MQKDLFFYSKFCDHCKNVITVITKANIRELFVFVSVDDNKFNIPPFVTHVPSIVTKEKQLVESDSIPDYLEKYIKHTSISSDISPFSLDSQSSYSTSYTYLTENGYDVDGKMTEEKGAYIMLGADTRIYAPKEADQNTTNKSGKFDDSMYERFINNRNADDELLKRQQQSRASF